MLDDYSDVLGGNLRSVWPVAVVAAEFVHGRLVGGTALALHLRHRVSEDIDIMTLRSFDGRDLRSAVERHMRSVRPDDYWRVCQVIEARRDGYAAIINDVRFDVFLALGSGGARAEDMRWLQAPRDVEGMAVGELPDLFASKLAAATNRSKLRDLIDLAALDRDSGYTLEDGLEFYRRAFGFDRSPDPSALRRVLRVLADPGYLEPDRAFEDMGHDALGHLRRRAEQVMDYMVETADQDTLAADARHAADMGASRASPVAGQCGHLMPRAGARCGLPPSHKGPHRQQR